MKKIFAFMLAAIMTVTYVYADNGDTVRHEKYSISLSAKQNKPIMMFGDDEISKYQKIEKTIVNGLFDSKLDAEISVNYPNDRFKTQMAANIVWSIPVELSRALKLTASGNTNFWLDVDLSDISSGKFRFIAENPLDTDRYIYGDVLNDDNFSEIFENVDMAKTTTEITDEVKQIIKDNSTIKTAIKKKTVEISDEQFKNIIVEYVRGGYIKLNEEPSVIADRLSKVTLLGSDGITVEINEKSAGVKSYDISANIAFNVYDLYVNLFDDNDVGFKRENSDVDFTLYLKCERLKSQTPADIKFPELTKDNSTDLANPYPDDYPDDSEYGDDNEWRWVPEDIYCYFEAENQAKNFYGVDYFPVRDVFREMDLYGDVTVNDGEISCSDDGADSYKAVTFKEFSKNVILDGVAHEMPMPVLEQDGVAYVPVLFFTDTLHGTFTDKTVSRTYDYENDAIYDYTAYYFRYPNPYYIN